LSNVIPIKGPRARQQKCQRITTVEQINKDNATFWATTGANADAHYIAKLQSAEAVAYARSRKQSGAGAAKRKLHGDKRREFVRVEAARVLQENPGISRSKLAVLIAPLVHLSEHHTLAVLKELKIPVIKKTPG
jgi:hypothetical protein